MIDSPGAAEAGYQAGLNGRSLWACDFRGEARTTWIKFWKRGLAEKKRQETSFQTTDIKDPVWRNW